jgi:hypothetical protein
MTVPKAALPPLNINYKKCHDGTQEDFPGKRDKILLEVFFCYLKSKSLLN